jgi:glycerol-3-phosphate acyltransferase PlsY
MVLKVIIFSVLSYLVGCVCFGYYITRYLTGVSLKEIGSHSLGATNVSRVLGKKGFLGTFILDFLKGYFIVSLATYLNFPLPTIFLFSLLVVAGHIWPIQLGFKGGKGISTFLGTIIAINIQLAVTVLIAFSLLFLVVRKFSISGIISFITIPIFLYFKEYAYLCVFLSILQIVIIFIAHRQNIHEFFKKDL